MIDKSAGYLSDVELGNVPPPSEAVIVQIAEKLGVDKKALLSAAKKVDPELAVYVSEQPQAADFLRMAKDQGYNAEDWKRLTEIARLSRLGKGDEIGK
jgi:transcriptional regulator with XRE-family HTH domain